MHKIPTWLQCPSLARPLATLSKMRQGEAGNLLVKFLIVGLSMCDTREFCRSSRDSTIGVNFDAIGEVEHYDHLSGDLMDVLKSGENSDVTFVVESERFYLHRAILSARCRYFNVLLYGNMLEARTNDEIVLKDTPAEGFRVLVEYIYTGRICLSDQSEQVSYMQLLLRYCNHNWSRLH